MAKYPEVNFEPEGFGCGPGWHKDSASYKPHPGCKRNGHYSASFYNCVRCAHCHAHHKFWCIVYASLDFITEDRPDFIDSFILTEEYWKNKPKKSIVEEETSLTLSKLIKKYLGRG
jgi:hypothetical protein